MFSRQRIKKGKQLIGEFRKNPERNQRRLILKAARFNLKLLQSPKTAMISTSLFSRKRAVARFCRRMKKITKLHGIYGQKRPRLIPELRERRHLGRIDISRFSIWNTQKMLMSCVHTTLRRWEGRLPRAFPSK